jgi:hypothetical protein
VEEAAGLGGEDVVMESAPLYVRLTDKGTAAAAALKFVECLNGQVSRRVQLEINDESYQEEFNRAPFVLICGEEECPVTWNATEGRWETPPL